MTVFGVVRESLTQSRRAGLSFDTAWTLALMGLQRPRGRMDGYAFADELTALLEARDVWARAYRREPPSGVERAAAMVKMPA